MLLIVSKPKIQAEDLSDMMNFMGVLSLAATPTEAIFEISENYRALIVISGEKIEEETEGALLHRAKELQLPTFSLSKDENSNYDFTLKRTLSASEILSSITSYCKSYGYRLPGEYVAEDLDLSLAHREALCYSESITLTRTEAMIVKALLRFYPRPAKASEILKIAFRAKRLPDEASIRTHISKINKKAMIISGRPLISNFDKLGYVLYQKELAYLLGNG